MLGAVTMLAALGLLATFGTSVVGLVVSTHSDARLARLQPYSDHFVLCGWNTKTVQILEELRSDPRIANAPVVLVADLPAKPDKVPHFVAGHLTPSTMEQANLAGARAVIVLGGLQGDAFASGALGSALLTRAARDPGVTRIVSELLRSRQGHELILCPTPSDVVGKAFLEALVQLKQDYNLLVVGIQSGEGILHTNPPATYQMRAVDRLYVIAAEHPSFAPLR